MIAAVIRRALATIPVMGMVAIFVFSLLSVVPGDPAAILAGDRATAADVARIHAQLGLDEAFPLRFGHWLWGLLHGDLGTSIWTKQPVARLIGQRLEPTLALILTSLLVSVAVAGSLGVIAARQAGTAFDRVAMVLTVAGASVPSFVLADIVLVMFAVPLRLAPAADYVGIRAGLAPFLSSMILPAIALAVVNGALVARLARAGILELRSRRDLRKGIADREMLAAHARRTAAAPIATVLGVGVALLISGVIVTENVFNIPGVGRLALTALAARDYPLLQGVILLCAAAYVLVDLVVDIGRIILDRASAPAMVVAHAETQVLPVRRHWLREAVNRRPTVALGTMLLLAAAAMALLAPDLGTVDPHTISFKERLLPPSALHWFGTDELGRDVWSRTLFGARVSLQVGLGVAGLSTVAGLAIALAAGVSRAAGALVLRALDGLTAVPPVLLVIVLALLTGVATGTIVIALTLAEAPRVARLMHGLRRRPVPTGIVAPLLVQAAYICASAMITEAVLSFLGVGVPPPVSSWGGMIRGYTEYLRSHPYLIAFPSLFLSLAVLAANLIGDGLRDVLDPRLARRR